MAEEKQVEVEGFDLRTEIRDSKTGKIIKKQPYRLKLSAEGELFERPVDSGFWYDRAGKLVKSPKKSESVKTKADV